MSRSTKVLIDKFAKDPLVGDVWYSDEKLTIGIAVVAVTGMLWWRKVEIVPFFSTRSLQFKMLHEHMRVVSLGIFREVLKLEKYTPIRECLKNCHKRKEMVAGLEFDVWSPDLPMLLSLATKKTKGVD